MFKHLAASLWITSFDIGLLTNCKMSTDFASMVARRCKTLANLKTLANTQNTKQHQIRTQARKVKTKPNSKNKFKLLKHERIPKTLKYT